MNVAFPNMTATDVGTPEPTITCTGNFVGSPLTFLAKDATAQRGVFPVSAAATTVSCVARDEAGNNGTASFTVTVGCPTGFTVAAGMCRGELRQGRAGGGKGMVGRSAWGPETACPGQCTAAAGC
jgi:hypothetical protein